MSVLNIHLEKNIKTIPFGVDHEFIILTRDTDYIVLSSHHTYYSRYMIL